jgi:hypothetical protein
VLVYDGERCVGWCQFGPPAEVAPINNAKAYEKGLADSTRSSGPTASSRPYPEQTEERSPQRVYGEGEELFLC